MHCKLPYNSVPGLILISHGVTGALSRIMCRTGKVSWDNGKGALQKGVRLHTRQNAIKVETNVAKQLVI